MPLSRWILVGVLVTTSAPNPSTVALQSPELTRCAEAAAAWWNGKQGIVFEAINADEAIRLCEVATRVASPAADAWAFLARALARAERYSDMRVAIDRAVAAGSAAGLWYRGVMFERGYGVREDVEEAAKWYMQAAERGNPIAQLNLGFIYVEGTRNLGREDNKTAVMWFRRAAEQGHPEAQFQLGFMLQDFSGGYDPEAAAEWLERAATLGHSYARLYLGRLYAEGRGVRQDASKALSYFRQARGSDDKELNEEVVKGMIAVIPAVRDLPSLTNLISDENPQIRSAAATGLGELEDLPAVPLLTRMLTDDNAAVVASAVAALRQYGGLTASAFLDIAGDARGLARVEILKAAADSGVGDERVLQGLIAALSDKDPSVRRAAAEGLAKTEDVRAVSPLTARLRDADVEVRKATIVALRSLGDRPAFEILMPLLADPNETVRHEAIRALGELADPRAVEPLTRELADPEDRRAAIWALADLGDARAVPALIGQLGDRDVGGNAAEALATIGDVRAIAPIIAALSAADRTREESFDFSFGLYNSLRLFSGDDANRLLLEVLQKDPRRSSTFAKSWRAVSVESLLALLSDPSAELRASVVGALGTLGDRRSVDPLIKCLSDPEETVRRAAATALGELGDLAALEPLIARLGDPVSHVRSSAALALRELGDPRAVEPLIGTLNDNAMQLISVLALEKIGDRRATKALVDALRPIDPRFDGPAERLIIIRALGGLKDPVAVEALIGHLTSDYFRYAAAAALALGEVGDPRAVEPLLGLLKLTIEGKQLSTDGEERRAVIRALGMLGDRRAAPALAAEARKAHKDRAVAAFSLFQLQDPRGLDLLVECLDDPRVSREAIGLLGETGDPRAVEPLLKQMESRTDGWEAAAVHTLLHLGATRNSRMLRFVASRPKLARTIIAEAERFQPELIDLSDTAGATAGDAVLLDLIKEAWQWQGDRAAVDSEILKKELPELRADTGTSAKPHTPFTYLMASRLHASNKNWSHALSYAERGLAEAPRRQSALRMALSWLKVESQWHTGAADAALLALDGIEKDLLPRVDPYERRITRLPFDSYTQLLRGAILFSVGRHQAALQALDKSDQALRIEDPRWLDGYTVERQRTVIHAYRNGGESAVLLATLRQKADEASEIQRRFEKTPASTALEQDAQRVNLEAGIKLFMADAATSPAALERAQALADQLQLKSQQMPPDVRPADPGRRAAVDELVTFRETLAQLNRQIASESVSQGAAPPTNSGSGNAPQKDLAQLRLEQAAVQRKLREFLNKIKRQYPEVAALVGAEPVDLRALQPRLGPEMRLLQYVLLDNQGWAFVVSPTDIQFVEIGIGRLKLRPVIERYRKLIQDPTAARGIKTSGASASSEIEARDVAASLAKWLLAPLESHLQGVTSLIVIPNGPLHQLPFAALPWRDGYLIQSFDLRFLSKTSLLAAVIDRPTVSTGALVLGNPSPPDPIWRPLPDAEVEATEIAAMLPGARALVGAAAKRSALVGQDLTRHLVHLALHGQAGSMESTRLVLSDGYLTVSEVWGLSLEGAPLVVLSACETALGQQLSGDEIISLADGFLFAGSRAVISTLWPVEDRSTRELMTTFYRGRQEGTAKALVTAQRALIAKGYGPYHWAAFVLSGW